MVLFACSQEQASLTADEKIEDFEYFYQIVEENYPFLGVYERENNLNWLSKKQQYINYIKHTSDDPSFLTFFQSVLYDLKMSHLSMRPTFDYDLYVSAYKELSIKKPQYKKWLKVLKNPKQRAAYWQNVHKNMWRNNTGNSISAKSINKTQTSNLSTQILKDKKTAIIRIKSFSPIFFDKDSPKIEKFLKEIKNNDFLIIDIQDNYGGSDEYWKKLIVEKLIDDKQEVSTYQVIKNGRMNHLFFSEILKYFKLLQPNNQLTNTPKELLNGGYLYNKQTEIIQPVNSIKFQGKIFLLVNRNVMSSSESFAYFCKYTKWATVAGERTGGDGMCGEPTLFMLPNSGIICNFPSLFSLNADGSINAETSTIPDISIKGDSPEKRLEQLLIKIHKKLRKKKIKNYF